MYAVSLRSQPPWFVVGKHTHRLTNAKVDQPEEEGPVHDGGGEEGEVGVHPVQQAHGDAGQIRLVSGDVREL